MSSVVRAKEMLLCTLIVFDLLMRPTIAVGDTSCPCINLDLSSYLDSTSCSDPNTVQIPVSGTTYCYPKDYGSSDCKAWDKSLHPECAESNGVAKANAPAWCLNKWCWVDTNSCALASGASSVSSNLSYSYATCGSLDLFTTARVAGAIRGSTLKVHALNEPPMVYPDRPADHPVGRGYVWDLFTDIFETAGAFTEHKDLRPYNGSAWSQCVEEVSMGYVDLCLGTFWETAERRQLVNFISPFAADNFFLVVMEAKLEKQAALLGVFEPFTTRLWVCILVWIFVIAGIIYYLEFTARGPDHAHFRGDESFVEGVFASTYLACIGFWTGGVAHDSQTPGGRMVTLAFGIFVILALAGYTANLASFLVTKLSPTGDYNSFQEVILDGGKLCMWSSAYTSFVANHPTGANHVVQVSTTEEAMQKLDAGTCKGVINSEKENHMMLTKREHCNKLQVGTPVMTLMLSQPVSEPYANALSYWLLHSKPLQATLSKKYAPQNFCVKKTGVQDARSMDIDDFYGTFLVTGVASVIGIAIRVVRLINARVHHRKLSGEPSDEPDEAEESSVAPATIGVGNEADASKHTTHSDV